MATIRFEAPNFRGSVSKKNDSSKRFWYYMVADSLEAAQANLRDKGFIVHKVESYDFINDNSAKIEVELKCYSQKKVCEKCQKKNRDKHEFRDLWKELKNYLIDLFHRKCAYCETKFAAVAFGDVEHYRPKAKVTDDKDHPGYFWLAYEPSNYLPSCQICNQGGAKANNFPVAGKRAYNKGDSLPDEKPLLLNPYDDDYFEHVGFFSSKDETPGKAFGHTLKGTTTIELLKLNRGDLVERRRHEQKYARAEILRLITSEDRKALDEMMNEIKSGQRQYATATLSEIEHFCRSMGISFD